MRRSGKRGVRVTGLNIITKPNGKRYVYHRATGKRLPDLPENHPEFLTAWAEAESGPKKYRAEAGTLAHVIQQFLASPRFKEYAPGTQEVRRRVLGHIMDKGGHVQFAAIEAKHIAADVQALSKGASSGRLKAWRALCDWASPSIRPDNPAAGVKAVKGTTTPHRRWMPEHVAQFREFWPIGTTQRLAFEVLHWTGARISDAHTLGRQMLTDGWLNFDQQKTGGAVELPWSAPLPIWARDLAPDQAHLLDALRPDTMIFVLTEQGQPFSEKGFGNMFNAAARKAGLDGLTAHGLRKTRASRLAEIGATALQIMSWTGHESLSEVENYIKEANRVRAMRGQVKEARE